MQEATQVTPLSDLDQNAPVSHQEDGRDASPSTVTTATTPTESSVGESADSTPSSNLGKFAGLLHRHSLRELNASETRRDPRDFFADVRLTPIKIVKGVYQVLGSAPGLRATDFHWKYSILNHGNAPHTWSLLQMGANFDTTIPLLRPLAYLKTSGRHLRISESMLTDLKTSWDAHSFKLVHYYDSWKTGGCHIGFQPDVDYRYEWKLEELPVGSGCYVPYLWQIDLNDPRAATPAARIVRQDLIQNPLKAAVPDKDLWCLEVDLDKVAPHIAMLSAFNLKVCHPKWHSWFAAKSPDITPPMPLLNFAFQDEGRIYQRQEKVWADSDDQGVSKNRQKAVVIPVFNKAYLEKYAIPAEVLEMLSVEAKQRKELIKMTLSIYD